jgi:hypothetical protein
MQSGSTILAFEMGLGKTLTSLTASLFDGLNNGPVLAVVPKVAEYTWRLEMARLGVRDIIALRGVNKPEAWALQLAPDGFEVNERRCPKDGIPGAPVICTHESLRAWGHLIAPAGGLTLATFDGDPETGYRPPPGGSWLLVDEAHRFGNYKAKSTGALLVAARHFDSVGMLTGTPLLGGAHRLWPLLKMADWGTWGSYYDFLGSYCVCEETEWGPAPVGLKDEGQLRRDTSRIILYRSQDEVASYLPKHTQDRVFVPMTREIAKGVGDSLAGAKKVLKGRGLGAEGAKWDEAEVVKVRIAIGKAKVPACGEMARELVDVPGS